ncbi:MAG: hypothetical protein KY464_05795 [Gemmatimonadetes bacterium]|nr:hypothetical protein [Gemmatimonadota bacterium]
MRVRIFMAARWLLLAAVALPGPGCRSASTTAAAAAGAAGTAAAIMLNNQNAEADIVGSVADVDRRTRVVLGGMGLQVVDAATEDSGAEREYEARGRDRVVHVKLVRRAANSTRVAVSSRLGTTVDYDVTHARMVVQRIQQQR